MAYYYVIGGKTDRTYTDPKKALKRVRTLREQGWYLLNSRASSGGYFNTVAMVRDKPMIETPGFQRVYRTPLVPNGYVLNYHGRRVVVDNE